MFLQCEVTSHAVQPERKLHYFNISFRRKTVRKFFHVSLFITSINISISIY